MYGLIGPNGAGKTTLMKVLVTLIEPSGGTLWIDGSAVTRSAFEHYRQMIGYLPQDVGFHAELTVYQTLDYYGILQKLETKARKTRIEALLHETSLERHAQKRISQLSGGMKRRVGLAQAMIHNPHFLVVDEPTAGLDPEERIRIRMLLSAFASTRTILLSTHVVEDVASTCDSVLLLDNGELLFNGQLSTLIDDAKGFVYTRCLANEKDFMVFREQHTVSSVIYTKRGINVRYIGRQSSPEDATEEPTVEDAYLLARNPGLRG